MKKIGKKLSFFTKIMVVIGLLISNLSSLTMVFAYEMPDDVVITLEEDTLKIKYTEALAEDVGKVKVYVYERYTYLDGETVKIDSVEPYELNATQMESAKAGELELTHTKSTFKLFDGTYNFEVKFYEVVAALPEVVNELEPLETQTPEVTEELITMGTYTENVTYKSGLNLKVYNSNNEELGLVNGKYSMPKENAQVSVDAYVLSGGLSPSDKFVYEEVEYTAEQLLEKKFTNTYNYSGNLYGEYNETISVELSKVIAADDSGAEATETSVASSNEVLEASTDADLDASETIEPKNEIVTYSKDVKFMYGTYADNTARLNLLNTMGDTYYFYGDGKDGILYSFIDLTLGTMNSTMLDLYNMLENFVSDTEIEYKLLKGDLDLIKEYNAVYGTQVAPVVDGEETTPTVVTIEDYLEEITVDESVKVTLSSGDETISYDVVVLGDINNDGSVDETDVDALIDLVVSGTTENVNADVYGLDGVNNKDILYLKKVLEEKNWNTTLDTKDASLDIELTTDLEEETKLVSGDEFIVDYTLKLSADEVSGFSGMFDYDKEALELVSVEPLNEAIGSYDKETGKFFYLGNESLTLPEAEEPTDNQTNPEDGILPVAEATVVTADHVVLRAKFRVLKSGTHSVSVKDNEYYNLNTYLNVADLESTVTVEALQSDDNKLTYLEVAGVVIELLDDVYEYELTVENEVTLVDLKYILSNVAAKVTSTIYPEELDEGINEVTISVVSESGLTQDYKVIVTRKEAVKETTTQVNYDNYQPNYNVEEEEVVKPTTPIEPEEPVEEKESNLSKIIIMVLIVLVIGGLVYLIFKDDETEEVKSVNKKIDKLKNEDADFESKVTKNTNTTKNNKKKPTDKKKTNNKKGNSKKER